MEKNTPTLLNLTKEIISAKIDRGYIMKTLSVLVSKDDSRLKEIEELFTRYTV